MYVYYELDWFKTNQDLSCLNTVAAYSPAVDGFEPLNNKKVGLIYKIYLD